MSEKFLILVVEDSKLLRDTMTDNLAADGYAIETASGAQDLIGKLGKIWPDLILLDLILPDGNGLQLLKNIREHTDVPVIIISGKSEMVDKIVGLEMGADDYVAKPLHMKELSARVKAQIRRYKSLKAGQNDNQIKPQNPAQVRIKFGEWILDREQFQAFSASGLTAGLTVKEFRLLETLISNANKVLSREQLLDKARSGEYNTTDRAIDVQILRIRKKIGDVYDPPQYIKSVRGIGYSFIAKTEVF